MRVLGIDPGTFKMGVGVIDSNSRDLTHVFSTVLSARSKDTISDRLHFFFKEISHIVVTWRPSEMAIEQPFAGTNIRAAMSIGHAQAVAMVAAASHELPVSAYTPRQVKKSVTDYGGSSKDQVGDMVRVLLDEDVPAETEDLTDALAVAICHVNSSFINELTILE